MNNPDVRIEVSKLCKSFAKHKVLRELDWSIAAGAVVGILGRNEKIATERAEAIIADGGRAIALVANVLDENELTLAKEKMMAHFGKIDGLVNAAGGNMPEGVIQPEADI